MKCSHRLMDKINSKHKLEYDRFAVSAISKKDHKDLTQSRMAGTIFRSTGCSLIHRKLTNHEVNYS